jgi:hypothetical protein
MLYSWFRLFENKCRNRVAVVLTTIYSYSEATGCLKFRETILPVTLDHGIILPFSHCSRLKLAEPTRQLVYHYPLYPHIWLLPRVSKMPPVKQYILIKAACTRLQRCVRASSSSIAWSSKGYVTVVQDN